MTGEAPTEFSDVQWKAISLTHVEYPKGDLFGYILAWFSLSPLIIGIALLTLVVFRRDLHTIFYLTGIVLNEVVNYVLKHVIKEQRPITDRVLHVQYGMPSSHAQFIWFFSTYLMLFILIRLHRSHSIVDELWKYLSVILGFLGALAVSYSRIYLGYHSTSQVAWGAVTGAVLGVVWFILVQVVFTPLFPTITTWPLAELFMIRDCTLIPNVMWFEYTSSRAEARTRLRKQRSS